MPVAVTPDTVVTLRQLLLDRAAAAGDDEPVIRSRRAPNEEPPFTLLKEAGELRARHAPVLNPARVTVSAYALTDTEAVRRYRRHAGLVHGFGPAIVSLEAEDGGDVGVWRVFDETGPQRPIQEPDTGWWLVTGVFDLYMTDRAV